MFTHEPIYVDDPQWDYKAYRAAEAFNRRRRKEPLPIVRVALMKRITPPMPPYDGVVSPEPLTIAVVDFMRGKVKRAAQF